ncbi:site-specific integrase [Bacillus cereus]|uniref:Integrase n=1 Tax=Bacillus cereus TaxID=1396 RepID=A0A2B9E280_BACCE|nr:site-specific integrase [Bacillus cereus]PGM93419.1 integrase [Bacillus cereus]
MSIIEDKAIEESLEEFNDFQFDIDNMIQQAIEILEDQKSKELLIEGTFEDDEWRFICDTRHSSVYFNFATIRERMTFWNVNSTLIIQALKCWMATLIPYRSLESLNKYYKYVENFLTLSRACSEDLLEQTNNHLLYECDDRTRWNLCIPTLNFIDFYEEIDVKQTYKKMLVDIKKDIDIQKVGGMIRKLPPSNDVLTFSWVIESFFKEISKEEKHFLRYYPIYLWWTLSNLIPMRPAEFCDIDRNALSIENGKHYIRLPRLKQKANHHKIQVIDKISIPQKLYQEIENYITMTNAFGPSKTLISDASIGLKRKLNHPEYFKKRFRYDHLKFLLNDFYDQIIENAYQVEYTHRIRLGDTRHFAFLNLMRQGYHPVEIARLGGHTSVQSQYHYQQHMEYWVDVEILQLMQKFKFQQEVNKENPSVPGSYHNYLDDDFVREKVLKINDTGFKMELETGYCTDPNVFCQVDKCYFCDYWKINPEEFLSKKEQIEHELQQCKNEVSALIKTLNNLYSIALNESFEDDFSEFNQEFNKDLLVTKNQLDTSVHKMLNFSSKLANTVKGTK